MSDSRFYTLMIVAIVIAGLGSIVALDVLQPSGVNVALVEKIMTILTVVLPVLCSRLGNSKEAAIVAEKAETAKEVAAETREELKHNSQMTEEIASKLR